MCPFSSMNLTCWLLSPCEYPSSGPLMTAGVPLANAVRSLSTHWAAGSGLLYSSCTCPFSSMKLTCWLPSPCEYPSSMPLVAGAAPASTVRSLSAHILITPLWFSWLSAVVTGRLDQAGPTAGSRSPAEPGEEARAVLNGAAQPRLGSGIVSGHPVEPAAAAIAPAAGELLADSAMGA